MRSLLFRGAAPLVTFALVALALVAAPGAAQRPAAPGCPPVGETRASLATLKQSVFTIADSARRNAFAVALTACLADPDPTIRDGVAFEGLQTWMRGKQLAPATIVAVRDRLLAMLASREGDGFAHPFAALVLAEVARTDRVAPWMSAEERSALVATAADYVKGVRDYRGFDAREGWRHGVAHGADLLMQLAYNPALTRADLDRILAAVASQVTPPGHAYVFGEAERLAQPVFAVARRALHTQAEWGTWLAAVAAPAPLARWADAYATPEGLAKRHDTMAFLSFIYVNAKISGAAPLAVLLPGAEAGLRSMP
jgi:hypothetical protein